MADTIKLTIDGKSIEVEKGTTVLQAAGRLGVDVPRYCYHPGLSIAGNCRICMVEIEKFPKLVTSCTTQAADGMVVRTTGPTVEEARRAVMEFLLANHPLDCPICDQAGECWLQDYSFRHGAAATRFQEQRIHGFKQKPIGPHVVLDTERCIVCTRCIRFCDEITGTGELGVFQRGVYSYIDVFPGSRLDNPYSGNTVDICPVGALTLREFRFTKRVWELKDAPSVCGACARGCNVNLGTADNRIWRLTPRENQQVNRWWMCDEGRLSHEPLYGRPRLTQAQVRRDGEVTPMRWPEALGLLAERLREARPQATLAIVSAAMTLEDLYLVKRLVAEVLPGADVLVPERVRGRDDDLLIRADKTPNAAGAALLGLSVDAGNRRLARRLAEAASGKVDAILVLGEEVADLEPARRNAFVCAFSAFRDAAVECSDLALPAAAYGEFDGTWVNFQGRVQRVRRALAPPAVALEGWRMLGELMTRMGVPVSYGSWGDVLRDAAASVPALEGLGEARLGLQGVAL